MENKLLKALEEMPLLYGAFRSKIIKTDDIVTDKAFRDICASNACGMYGRCYMCPPDIGDVETLMASIGNYTHALVYQTVSQLEDSYDFEGMIEAKKATYPLIQSVRAAVESLGIGDALYLGAGGCGVCETCAKQTNEPCRFPNRAMPSLEAYGINVSLLAKAADMKYINGQDTVTYFGAVLFSVGGEEI